MNSVEILVDKVFDEQIRPLIRDIPLRNNRLDDLRLQVKELVFDGLYEIYESERILITTHASDEAYQSTVGPDIDAVFDYISAGTGSRKEYSELCDLRRNHMIGQLCRIIEKYQPSRYMVLQEHIIHSFNGESQRP